MRMSTLWLLPVAAVFFLHGETAAKKYQSAHIEVRCEGGACEEKFIKESLPRLEQWLGALYGVVEEERTKTWRNIPASEVPRITLHIVDENAFHDVCMHVFVAKPCWDETDGVPSLADSAIYLHGFEKENVEEEEKQENAGEKDEYALKAAWTGMVSLLFQRAGGRLPNSKEMNDLTQKVNTRLYTVDARTFTKQK